LIILSLAHSISSLVVIKDLTTSTILRYITPTTLRVSVCKLTMWFLMTTSSKYCWVCRGNNNKNPWIFDEVMTKKTWTVAYFLDHFLNPCIIMLRQMAGCQNIDRQTPVVRWHQPVKL